MTYNPLCDQIRNWLAHLGGLEARSVSVTMTADYADENTVHDAYTAEAHVTVTGDGPLTRAGCMWLDGPCDVGAPVRIGDLTYQWVIVGLCLYNYDDGRPSYELTMTAEVRA